MKKKYSAPIAEWIEAELGGLLEETVSFVQVENPDTPGPGFAEGKGGMEYEGGIFDE
jgi:hypothetical protein